MKKNTLKVGLLALVASTTLLTVTVRAADQQCEHYNQHEHHQMKGERGGHHDKMRKMFRGLDLTDEQKTQVKAILSSHRDEMELSRLSKEERTAQKTQMLAFITAANFNEAEVKQALMAKQEARQQKAVNMMKLQNEVYQLLTPEQQQKFEQRFAKNKHHKR
ncbi:MAG: protein CpxP [Shewanella sp.]|jgi:protein CpxP